MSFNPRPARPLPARPARRLVIVPLHPATEAIPSGAALTPPEQQKRLRTYVEHMKRILGIYSAYLGSLQQIKTEAERWAEGLRIDLRQTYAARQRTGEKREQDRRELVLNDDDISTLSLRINEPQQMISSLESQVSAAEANLQQLDGEVSAYLQEQQRLRAAQRHKSTSRQPSPSAPDQTVAAQLSAMTDENPIALINHLYGAYAARLQIDALVVRPRGGSEGSMVRLVDWRRTGRYLDLLTLAATFYREGRYRQGHQGQAAWANLLNRLCAVSVPDRPDAPKCGLS